MGKITHLNLLIVDQRLPRSPQKMHKLQVKIGKAAKTSCALHLALALSPVGAAFFVALARVPVRITAVSVLFVGAHDCATEKEAEDNRGKGIINDLRYAPTGFQEYVL